MPGVAGGTLRSSTLRARVRLLTGANWSGMRRRITVTGLDATKVRSARPWTGQIYQSGPVSADHAINYEHLSRGAGKCTLEHCRRHCGAFYFYSQGCGRRFDRAEMWAQTNNADTRTAKKLVDLELELAALSSADAIDELLKWQLKHHGHCQECMLCAAGKFNPGCNRWQEQHLRGSCESCIASCDVGYFQWHAVGAPLQKEPQGRVTSNYKCKKCPTWVQNTSRIYTVLECGNKQQFAYHEYGDLSPEGVTYSQTEVEAKFTPDESSEILTVFKPFFHLEPYALHGISSITPLALSAYSPHIACTKRTEEPGIRL
jgi:hypothetical protein